MKMNDSLTLIFCIRSYNCTFSFLLHGSVCLILVRNVLALPSASTRFASNRQSLNR